jgi:hypothetical protein
MVGNKRVAEQISELMLEYSVKLNEALILVMENCPEDEFNLDPRQWFRRKLIV